MTKIVKSGSLRLKLLGKALALFVLVSLSWSLANITKLIRRNADPFNEKEFRARINSVPEAKADVPPSKGTSTPFLAYFDGKAYRLENDFLFGRPKSFHPSFEIAKTLYQDGRIYPDLYKIVAPLKAFFGKIRLQVQEIELEESFFKWLRLRRVIHPEDSEVIVDSEYRKFHVVDRRRFEKELKLPNAIATKISGGSQNTILSKKLIWETNTANAPHVPLSKGEELEIIFKNLVPGKETHLVVKSWFRDWQLGLEETWKEKSESLAPFVLFRRMVASPLAVVGGLALLGWLEKNGLSALGLSAFSLIHGGIGGTGTGSTAGSTGGTGSTGSTSGTTYGSGCSLVYRYQDGQGLYHRFAVTEPRAWHYNTEVVELPQDAVQPDGTLRLKISSSKRHIVGFAGAIQSMNRIGKPYVEEAIDLEKAYHHRLKMDMASDLKSAGGNYVQTIPGDIIDLEFSAPQRRLDSRERETYLMQASGFYTSLRRENRTRMGNWQERLSPEAKERLATLTPLKNY